MRKFSHIALRIVVYHVITHDSVLLLGAYYIILALPRTGPLYPSGHQIQTFYSPSGTILLSITTSEVCTAMMAL